MAYDSRKKLESDVQKFAQVYYASTLLVYDKVIALLDRQAAITERETMERYSAESESVRCTHAYKTYEEIVRCRDCRNYKPNTYSHFTCELLTYYVEPNGFCAWGERRDDVE